MAFDAISQNFVRFLRVVRVVGKKPLARILQAQQAGLLVITYDESEVNRLDAERLITTYADTILRISYTYLHSTADAEDICQEVLLKLLQHGAFDTPEHERAWVVRVASNACKDELRRRSVRPSVALDEVPEVASASAPTEEEQRAKEQSVLKAVMSLALIYREVIYWYYYEDMSIAEIAQLIDASEAAVAQRLSRARAQLKTILQNDSFEEGLNDE